MGNRMNNCTNRNPSPPCTSDKKPKVNKWGNTCCYKNKTKKIKCSKRNPEPPCKKGYYSKKNLKGDLCCYKDSKSMHHLIKQFSLLSDVEISLDLARNLIYFSGNTFPIKDRIKDACKSIQKKCNWDNAFKTWSAPLNIIYTEYLKDIVDVNKLPKLQNKNLILCDIVNLSKYSSNKNQISSYILYGETDSIIDLIYFYGGSFYRNIPYKEQLLKDVNCKYWEFGSDMSLFENTNLKLLRDVFGLNQIDDKGVYGKGMTSKYK